jgi:exopolysaccharide biosynthesis polyprenyl glycosylphosphotransferase
MVGNHLKIDKVQGALSRTLDFVCLVSAFAITGWIASILSRTQLFIWPASTSSDIAGWPAQYVVLLLSTLIAWSIVSGYLGIYKSEQSDHTSNHFGRLIRAGLLWMAATGLAIFLFKLGEVSRLFVLSYVLLASVLIALRDYSETLIARRVYRSRGVRRTAVVIGAGTQASWLRQFLLDNYCPEPYALVRQVDPLETDHADTHENLPADGRVRQSGEAAEVFVAAADVGADASCLFPRIFERATETHLVPGVFDASIFKPALGSIGGIPVITLRTGALTGLEAAIKRAFDFVISAILLTIAAPVMILIASLVKLSSPGPVFFRQERVGKGGRRILIYKFRTMHQNAEQILKSDPELYRRYVDSNYKLPKGKDPRITLLGHILRELSLDEIPQLINVLKGEMSLVGPRPVVPAEVEKYGDYASLLLSVQPGLTGQWQVSGRSDIADYARRVRLDMEYIRDQSIATDLQILFRTVPVVLSREGAY